MAKRPPTKIPPRSKGAPHGPRSRPVPPRPPRKPPAGAAGAARRGKSFYALIAGVVVAPGGGGDVVIVSTSGGSIELGEHEPGRRQLHDAGRREGVRRHSDPKASRSRSAPSWRPPNTGLTGAPIAGLAVQHDRSSSPTTITPTWPFSSTASSGPIPLGVGMVPPALVQQSARAATSPPAARPACTGCTCTPRTGSSISNPRRPRCTSWPSSSPSGTCR